ncbi:MAG: NnrS family protein [Polyangiaceae bacterium]|nr:NnrS family protein [Polyangiaceae bacterium]
MEVVTVNTMLRKRDKRSPAGALLEMGFRPFFLLGSAFSAVAMAIWYLVYRGAVRLPLAGLDPQLWHAHEMVFGFGGAIVGGFLLTAARNWTSLPTASGGALVAIVLAWLAARLIPLAFGTNAIAIMALADMAFLGGVFVSIASPILRSKQTRQIPILGVLFVLGASHAAFYLGAWSHNTNLLRGGLYAGLYAILLMVLLIAARVVPFFVEKGIPGTAKPEEPRWLFVSVPLLFVAYAALDVAGVSMQYGLGAVSALLAILTTVRMGYWYRRGVLSRPLLWVLFVAYAGFPLGFLLRALAMPLGLAPSLALHALSVGAIGVMTLGMMARVTLGHTGRVIASPPRASGVLFGLLACALVARVIGPASGIGDYVVWMSVAQVLWILAFASFAFVFGPMLVAPRVDGKPG